MRVITALLTTTVTTPIALALLASPASAVDPSGVPDWTGSIIVHTPTGTCFAYYELVTVDVANPTPYSGHTSLATASVPGVDVTAC